MGIKHSKRIRRKHRWPPASGTLSNFPAQPRNGEWQGQHRLILSPVITKRTLPLPALPKPRDLTGNSCFWAQPAPKRLRTKKPSAFPSVSGISELGLLTSRACNHLLVLPDHYCPPCPLHHCRRDAEQALSRDASSSSVTEHVCMHAHVCVHVHVRVVNGILLKLHYIFSIKHTISINSSTKNTNVNGLLFTLNSKFYWGWGSQGKLKLFPDLQK